MNNQPPVLTIQMVPAGVDMVLRGLNKLPREESDALYNEIAGQANYQVQELVKQAQAKEAAEKAAAEAAAKAAAAAEKAAKKVAKGKDTAPANDAPPEDPLS
jgi:regulator of protease activity HflC (stomatin/prohibitin superfamily)